VSDAIRRPALLLGLAWLGFVSLGLPDGLLGVAWPSIRGSFGLPLDALGGLLVATTSGYVLSSFLSGRILTRIGVGALLALSCLATAASLLGYALAPAWGAVIGFGLLAGLGAGAIDAGINTHVATHHSPRTLAFAHACYGLGAAAGPALMTGVLMAGRPWQAGYAGVGAAVLALGLAFAATRALWPPPAGAPATGGPVAAPPPAGATLRLPAARLGCAAFFVYTGLEATAGAWLYSLLHESRGVAMPAAGTAVSAYWGGLMAGRLVAAAVAGSLAPRDLVRACAALLAVAAAVVALGLGPAATVAGAALFGIAGGPIFPSLVAATPGRVGEAHAAHAIGFQIAAAALGQSLLPAAVGVAAARAGLEIVGPVLFGGSLVLFAVHEALAARREPAPLHATGVPQPSCTGSPPM
jgi:fucose permease